MTLRRGVASIITMHKAISSPIRVLLVDDHFMVRRALCTMLNTYDDIDVVGEGSDGKQAIELADSLRPDLVLMDINMPNINGIEATACIKLKHPDIHVIGLSINTGPSNRKAIHRAGADALVTKEVATERLYAQIHQVVKDTRLSDS